MYLATIFALLLFDSLFRCNLQPSARLRFPTVILLLSLHGALKIRCCFSCLPATSLFRRTAGSQIIAPGAASMSSRHRKARKNRCSVLPSSTTNQSTNGQAHLTLRLLFNHIPTKNTEVRKLSAFSISDCGICHSTLYIHRERERERKSHEAFSWRKERNKERQFVTSSEPCS